MSLLSIASKAAGAAASPSSSSKSSVASAGSNVGKGVSGVTVTSATKSSVSTTKSSGPTGVAAIANAYDTNGGKSSSPAVVKTISSAGKAAAAAAGGAGKTGNSKSTSITGAATSAGGGASKTAHAAAIDSYNKSSTSAGVGVVAAGKAGVDLGLTGRAVAAFAGLGALAGGFWLMATGPAGGDSERAFERMVNANLANTNAGERKPAATPTAVPVEKGDSAATASSGPSGDIKKPADVPKDWVEQPGNKEGHVKWVNPDNPHDYVRGKPDGTYTQVRDGKAFDVNGKPVDLKSKDAHGITLGDFVFRPGKKK